MDGHSEFWGVLQDPQLSEMMRKRMDLGSLLNDHHLLRAQFYTERGWHFSLVAMSRGDSYRNSYHAPLQCAPCGGHIMRSAWGLTKKRGLCTLRDSDCQAEVLRGGVGPR